MRKRAWVVLLLGGVAACGGKPAMRSATLPAPETEILLAYNSDEKGDYKECTCKTARLGGLVRRATALTSYRTNHPNVLPVNGGGWAVTGTLESQRVQSEFLLQTMGKLGYKVVNVAPADLSYGVAWLRDTAKANGLAIVASNLKSKATDSWVFEPYTIVPVQGLRIAFLGVMEEGEALSPVPGGNDDLMTVDAQDAVRALIPEVRAKADCVVLFAHLGQRQARLLLEAVPGIDVAISGKDGFVNYKATEVGLDANGKTLLLEAGERGKYLGALSMVLDAHGKILRFDNQVNALDHNVPDDSPTVTAVAALDERLREIRKREAVDQAVGSSTP